ncbi:unnamed protein product [Nippostrongylus brasiliensis]|uniref:Ovule protein n=1 Tax=Nippostrongylus brasiliensis TaxID=27835 RepID=A0A0N4YYZ0_NIPBR|nr:unnamed protein product [Nippostrongylus brasiliensis]
MEDSLELYRKVMNIFAKANMNLRQFRSNNEDVNGSIATADLSSNPQQKVLGISWTTENDVVEDARRTQI